MYFDIFSCILFFLHGVNRFRSKRCFFEVLLFLRQLVSFVTLVIYYKMIYDIYFQSFCIFCWKIDTIFANHIFRRNGQIAPDSISCAYEASSWSASIVSHCRSWTVDLICTRRWNGTINYIHFESGCSIIGCRILPAFDRCRFYAWALSKSAKIDLKCGLHYAWPKRTNYTGDRCFSMIFVAKCIIIHIFCIFRAFYLHTK